MGKKIVIFLLNHCSNRNDMICKWIFGERKGEKQKSTSFLIQLLDWSSYSSCLLSLLFVYGFDDACLTSFPVKSNRSPALILLS